MRPLVLLFVCLSSLGQAQNNLAAWKDFPFTKQRIRPEQISGLDGKGLEFLRGIIFGRHGRAFQTDEIQSFLAQQRWYKPNPKFSNRLLNATERDNLDVIRGAEAAKHKTVLPGDLRFWMNRPITDNQLGKPRLVDLHVMACEIEAIHGRRFNDEPSMQKYFEARYWYAASAKYDPKSLGPIERANLKVITDAEAKKRSTAISPGDMAAFESRPLTPAQLKGESLYNLRLLRNEIYARRRYHFYTQWLLDYFGAQEWYDPLPKGKEPDLSKVEEQNVATILQKENDLHQALLTEKVTPSELDGLMLEDARKLRFEIQARHGKAFRDSWTQSYFASLPWYKKSSAYSDKLLSRIERNNIVQIKKYELHAASEMKSVEG